MLTRTRSRSTARVLAFLVAWWAVALQAQESLPTAFTYQGQLKFEGAPLNGPCDLRFRLWDAETGGLQVGPTQTAVALPVVGGLFTLALDFGSVFAGQQLWLEAEVAHPAGTGVWVGLAPRQALLPAPQALHALGAPWSGLSGRPLLLGSLDGVSNDGGDIDLVAGPNVTIVPDPGGQRITISATAGGGDITAVLAGDGLVGDTATGDATLALAASYLDGSAFEARFVNEGQAAAITSTMLLDGAVTSGKLAVGVLDWGSLTGIPAQLTDGDQDTTYSAGSGLTLGGTVFSIDFGVVAAAAHAHNAAEISGGVLDDARVPAAIARDAEIMPTVLAGAGSGSGLDADRLDGLDATAFAALVHDHDERYYTEAEAMAAFAALVHDHDERYYTEAELSVSGGGGQVHWANLVDVPAGMVGGSAFDGRFVNEAQVGSIGEAMLSAAAVTSDKIADGTVGLADLGRNGALDGQVLKWSDAASAWVLAVDEHGASGTTYAAGSGLSLVGTVFSADFAAVAARTHTHAGEDLSSGIVAEPRIAAAIARDAEIMPTVLAGAGSGSGLDADRLDGLDAAAFAALVHDHDERYYTEAEATAAFAALVHDHDARYYTEAEATAAFAALVHDHDARYYTEAEATAAFAALVHDHDERYYTQAQLDTPGGGGRVQWANLVGVPEGFADGVDHDSGGDITGLTAGHGLTGGGESGMLRLDVVLGAGLTLDADAVVVAPEIRDGSAFDLRFVNEGQADAIANAMLQDNAVTATKIAPDLLSSLDGVSHDGGDIDLVPGAGISITADDGSNSITIAATPASASCWSLTGNSGTSPATQYLGTTDGQPLVLRVNGESALRLEPDPTSPNLIAGYWGNSVDSRVHGVSIAGGGQETEPHNVTADFGTVAGGSGNLVSAPHATVGGGRLNTAAAACSTVAGGEMNSASAPLSGVMYDLNAHDTIGGGSANQAYGGAAVVSGGALNQVTARTGAVGGGFGNWVSGQLSTIGGGLGNTAYGRMATIAGGGALGFFAEPEPHWESLPGNAVYDDGGSIGGGLDNRVGSDDGATQNTRDTICATVAGGNGNQARATYTTVAGGWDNRATCYGASVGGGEANQASGYTAVVGGGNDNYAEYYAATVAGGGWNRASAEAAAVGGGMDNLASGFSSTVGGGYNNWAMAQYAVIGGGGPSDPSTGAQVADTNNRVYDDYGTIGGGGRNRAGSDDGGTQDPTNAISATVSGGTGNTASATGATVGGGFGNEASDDCAAIAGGNGNRASGSGAAIGGGWYNAATALSATVAGGYSNLAPGDYATVAGGIGCSASGARSLAAGNRAKANGAGSFVWGDSNDHDIVSWGANEFVSRATGGFWLVTKIDPASGVPLEGMRLPANSSTWHPIGSGARKDSSTDAAQIRELTSANAALQKRVADLEARLAALEALTAVLAKH